MSNQRQSLYRENKDVLTRDEVFELGKIEAEIAKASNPEDAYTEHKRYVNTYERFMREHGIKRN